MSDFESVHPRDILAKVPDLDVREIEYTSFASTPLVSANLAGGKSQLLALDGKKIDGFDQQKVIDIVKNALPDPKALGVVSCCHPVSDVIPVSCAESGIAAGTV